MAKFFCTFFVYFVEPTLFGWNWLQIESFSKGYLDNPCGVIFAWIMRCVCQIWPSKSWFQEVFKGFAFDEAFRDAWRVAGAKVRTLESLCWFKVRAHIKNRVLFESVTLIYTCIQECCFSIWISCVNFVVGWELFPILMTCFTRVKKNSDLISQKSGGGLKPYPLRSPCSKRILHPLTCYVFRKYQVFSYSI